jgi:hypothetical protein
MFSLSSVMLVSLLLFLSGIGCRWWCSLCEQCLDGVVLVFFLVCSLSL